MSICELSGDRLSHINFIMSIFDYFCLMSNTNMDNAKLESFQTPL